MSGYITAKQRWQPNKLFRAGQPLKYRRTIGSFSKDYLLIAKESDAIPVMWIMWFENLYPNTWYLSTELINNTPLWPGDTFINFETGERYINDTNGILYAGEITASNIEDIALEALAITPFSKTKTARINPYYNSNYDETKFIVFSDYLEVRNYDWFLYKVDASVIFNVKVTGVAPNMITLTRQHSIKINYLDYTSVSFTGVSPDITTSTSCTYLFDNSIGDYILTITNNDGDITINRSNA